MTEHRRSIDIQAEPDALFAYLSDVANLPTYFERMTSARPAEGDRIDVTARLDGGREVEGEAWFRGRRGPAVTAAGRLLTAPGPTAGRGRAPGSR